MHFRISMNKKIIDGSYFRLFVRMSCISHSSCVDIGIALVVSNRSWRSHIIRWVQSVDQEILTRPKNIQVYCAFVVSDMLLNSSKLLVDLISR